MHSEVEKGHKKCGNGGACACGCKVTAERIRQRAYEIYLARRGGPGDACADWLQAEQELKSARGGTGGPAALPREQVAFRRSRPVSA